MGVAALLWNRDLLMYDEATGSLWGRIAATATGRASDGRHESRRLAQAGATTGVYCTPGHVPFNVPVAVSSGI